jgi:hypothetical protein
MLGWPSENGMQAVKRMIVDMRAPRRKRYVSIAMMRVTLNFGRLALGILGECSRQPIIIEDIGVCEIEM